MSADIIRERLKNKEQRVNFMNAMSDVSWQIEEFLAVYSSKKQKKLLSPRWQDKFIKKSLKLLLKIQTLIENLDLSTMNNVQVVEMIKNINNYPLSDNINIFEVAILLSKYYILFPYIYVDLAAISIALKDSDHILSIPEVREKVLSKYLPKLLNIGPNIYKTWLYLKNEKTVLSDFDKDFNKSMDSFILNFLTPDELKKVKVH